MLDASSSVIGGTPHGISLSVNLSHDVLKALLVPHWYTSQFIRIINQNCTISQSTIELG